MALRAAGQDHTVAAGADAQIGERDGLKAGGAEPVDGNARDLNGQSGAQNRPAGDIPSLLAFGLGAAEDHVFDFGFVQCGDFVQSAAERDCGQVVGAGGGESAFGGAANGGANGADEDGFRHVGAP